MQTTPLIKQGWLRALLYFVGLFFITLSASFFISPLLERSIPDKQLLFILSYSIIAFFAILFTWMMKRLVDRESFFSLGFNWKDCRNDGGMGAFTALAILGLGTLLLLWKQHIAFTGFEVATIPLVQQLILMIIVAFSEEIMFRGYILYNLMQSTNKWVALLVSAAIFAGIHVSNPGATTLPIINVFLAGILLGSNYIFTRNLWFSILLHFVWNFTQGAILGYEVSGVEVQSMLQQTNSGNLLWTGGPFGFEGSAVCTTLLIIFSIILLFLFRKKYTPTINSSIVQ